MLTQHLELWEEFEKQQEVGMLLHPGEEHFCMWVKGGVGPRLQP